MPRTISRIVDVDKGWKGFKRTAKTLGRKRVRVGIFGGRRNPASNEALGKIAVIMEYGSALVLTRPGHIPARPFMRRAIDRNQRHYFRFMREVLGPLHKGRLNIRTVLTRLGRSVQMDIRQEIAEARDWAAPLSQRRIREKGHDRPLVDTGALFDNIKFRVDILAGGRR